MLYDMPFLTAVALTVNTNQDITVANYFFFFFFGEGGLPIQQVHL